MIPRFRPCAALAAFTLAVSACSSGSEPSPNRSTSLPAPGAAVVSTTAPTDVGTPQIHVDAADLHAENTWDSPHYALQWPTLTAAPALSKDVADQITAWRRDFLSDTQGADGEHADLNVAWEPVVHAGNLYGIRLTNRMTSADSVLVSSTRYGDGSRSWNSADLLTPDARKQVTGAVAKAAAAKFHTDADDTLDPADVLVDVSFTTRGDLLLRVPEGTVAPMSEGSVYATVANPQRYLSSRGQQVRTAMTTKQTAPAALPSVAASAPTTNCATAKCIALTFDDGPGPYTSGILDTLQKKHARATFFMLGPAVQADPNIVHRMAELGMGLGDHSWTHPQFTSLSAAQVTDEITRQASAVKAASGRMPVAVRPPYGAFTKATPHAGYPFVLWDVDTEDWKNRNATITTQRALAGAHRGAIVLMHDIHSSTAQALPGIIDALQKQGYTLVPVSDLLPTMNPTQAYYSGR